MPLFQHQPKARSLILLFVVVSVTFLAATFFAEFRAGSIDQLASQIANNAAPSIRNLALARSEIRRLQSAVEDHLAVPARGLPSTAEDIRRARERLQRAIDSYAARTLFSGEEQFWEHMQSGLYQLDQVLRLTLERLHAHDQAAAEALAKDDLRDAVEECSAAFLTGINFNVGQAQRLAGEIETARFRSMLIAYGLDAVCIVLAIAAGVLAARTVKGYTGLMEAHHHLSARRIEELEFFAGRVAHDILSPLQAVGLGLDLVSLRSGGDQELEAGAKRAKSSLNRVQSIVTGLLDFARAGAAPTPGGWTAVKDILEPLVADLTPAAVEAGAELRLAPFRPCAVAAAPGVLTSLLMNLIRNAIKYLGDDPQGRIEVRVMERDGRVRFEIEDNGPGIPPELGDRIFEPHVRAHGSAKPGIGLGLATVKRLAVSHGGEVGVRSRPGRGSLFWFELPKTDLP